MRHDAGPELRTECVVFLFFGGVVLIERYFGLFFCIYTKEERRTRECQNKKRDRRHLQHSQMPQSCEICLGDFSEVVCVQLPEEEKGLDRNMIG